MAGLAWPGLAWPGLVLRSVGRSVDRLEKAVTHNSWISAGRLVFSSHGARAVMRATSGNPGIPGKLDGPAATCRRPQARALENPVFSIAFFRGKTFCHPLFRSGICEEETHLRPRETLSAAWSPRPLL